MSVRYCGGYFGEVKSQNPDKLSRLVEEYIKKIQAGEISGFEGDLIEGFEGNTKEIRPID